MGILYDPGFYYGAMAVMAVTAVIVFIALQFVEAPYGMTFSSKWGPSVGNRTGWIIMEAPAFICMMAFILLSPERSLGGIVCALLFLVHYFQRSFVFPILMRGRSRMSWLIPAMGAIFNVFNTYFIGAWLFHFAPQGYYNFAEHPLMIVAWIAGGGLFICGMAINLHSDYIIRNLRKPGETGHKIPRGGMYRYVTSANYFGEITEWAGYAIFTWSLAGLLFVVWTCANLVPRARKLHNRYEKEFGDVYKTLGRKRIFPFLY